MTESEGGSTNERRDFFASFSKVLMGTGLVTGYGAFGAIAGRFLYPISKDDKTWKLVAPIAETRVGEARPYKTPAGHKVSIARRGPGETVEDFVALSSTCPHLGCQVTWQAKESRFFCPCHNGAFDATGAPIAGPPKEADQSLSRYPLSIRNGLLFIEVDKAPPVGSERAELIDDQPTGAGHDPCLQIRFPDETV